MLYLGAIRHWEGCFAEAIAIFQQLIERSPNQLNPRVMLNFSDVEAGQAGLALTNICTWEAKTPTTSNRRIPRSNGPRPLGKARGRDEAKFEARNIAVNPAFAGIRNDPPGAHWPRKSDYRLEPHHIKWNLPESNPSRAYYCSRYYR
jgi:hypothetical protein